MPYHSPPKSRLANVWNKKFTITVTGGVGHGARGN